jgi:hypothetical protein
MAITPNYSWPVPDDTDLVKDGAEAIRDLGNAIDTTVDGLPSGGLVHIKTESFSAVSAVSVNDVFSAEYDNYLITLNDVVGSSATTTVDLRLRVSGSDASGADYNRQFLSVGNTVVSGARLTNATSMNAVSRSTTSNINYGKITLFNPFKAIATNATALDTEGASGTALNIFLATFNHFIGASYTGFSLLVSAGTFSGTVRVFGYRND